MWKVITASEYKRRKKEIRITSSGKKVDSERDPYRTVQYGIRYRNKILFSKTDGPFTGFVLCFKINNLPTTSEISCDCGRVFNYCIILWKAFLVLNSFIIDLFASGLRRKYQFMNSLYRGNEFD